MPMNGGYECVVPSGAGDGSPSFVGLVFSEALLVRGLSDLALGSADCLCANGTCTAVSGGRAAFGGNPAVLFRNNLYFCR
mmetsp:Transcript_5542/g.34302  ORF Transcript_5542/g.34302 Transcript_5542/m.34302 type:complete len:80 (+) Transcript_5542:1700-1939(+)